MAVTVVDALQHLEIAEADAVDKLKLYVDAANEWVAGKVTDTTLATVRLATLFLIDHLWQSQRGPAQVPLPGDEIVEVSGVGFAIPNRVRELLEITLARPAAQSSFPDARAWPDPVECL